MRAEVRQPAVAVLEREDGRPVAPPPIGWVGFPCFCFRAQAFEAALRKDRFPILPQVKLFYAFFSRPSPLAPRQLRPAAKAGGTSEARASWGGPDHVQMLCSSSYAPPKPLHSALHLLGEFQNLLNFEGLILRHEFSQRQLQRVTNWQAVWPCAPSPAASQSQRRPEPGACRAACRAAPEGPMGRVALGG